MNFLRLRKRKEGEGARRLFQDLDIQVHKHHRSTKKTPQLIKIFSKIHYNKNCQKSKTKREF